jgi:multidrug/hemolysin transport system permease protein
MALISRNRGLYFKDKGMMMYSFISPLMLIILYVTFLANVLKESFRSALPEFFVVSDKLINGAVAAQLTAALLAVSCVTVTFSVNFTMAQDKVSGAIRDFNVSPVRRPTVYFSYFFSTVLNSLMINLLALALCLAYVASTGWFLSVGDVFCLVGDVVLLVLFGSMLSSIITYPMTTQGQMSAVGIIVGAGYGFLCGAYMPISSFGSGLRSVLLHLPGTYGTSLLKNRMLRGVFEEMNATGFPKEAVDGIKQALDCSLAVHGHTVSTLEMLFIMLASVVILAGIYLLLMKLYKKD